MAKRKAPAPKPTGDGDQEEFDFSHLTRGDQVGKVKIEWEWLGRIRKGALNMIDGDQGVGKSTLLTAMAATISEGLKFPGERKACQPGSVLWMCSEEEYDADVVPRFTANGGNAKNIHNWPNAKLDATDKILLPHDVFKLQSLLKRIGARVLVIDPFSTMAAGSVDMNSEQQTRAYLESIACACVPLGVTVLMCRHWKKGSSGSVLGKGIGSVGISAVCRVVMAATLDPDTLKPGLLSTVKINNEAVPQAISYKIQRSLTGVPWLWWGDKSEKTLDEIMSGNDEAAERDALTDAMMMLKKILVKGRASAADIREEATTVGISNSTLRRAKHKLGIRTHRVSTGNKGKGYHYWTLPPAPKPPSEKA